MKVNVTQRDIDNARKVGGGTFECPIARALHRHDGFRAAGASADLTRDFGLEYSRAYTRRENSSGKVALPAVAGEFMRAFDYGEDVKPFTFELAL